jgi:hypothetical protein
VRKYKLFTLEGGDYNEIYLRSMDAEVVDRLFTELQLCVPSAKREDIPGLTGTYSYHFKELKRKAPEVRWWIVTQLCETGWEPFAPHGLDGLWFRQEVL